MEEVTAKDYLDLCQSRWEGKIYNWSAERRAVWRELIAISNERSLHLAEETDDIDAVTLLTEAEIISFREKIEKL